MPQVPTKSAFSTTLFERNIAALQRVDPALASVLQDVETSGLPDPEPTRSGHWTLSRQTPDGRSIYLHSRYDPVTEAKTWVSHQVEEGKFCYIVAGLGLGYHVAALSDELPETVAVVVLESDPVLVRLALSCHDFSNHLAAGRLAVLCEPNKHRVHQQLTPHSTHLLMGTKIVTHKPSEQTAAAGLKDLRELCLGYIEYAKTGMVTLVTNSQTTCRNVADNLAAYLASPPIDGLRSKFRGYPAIVVSAGPSLRKNVDVLHEVRDRAVVIAVQTTFKPLLARGIVPHFVCSLDYHEMSRQYYEGVEDFHDVHLVAEPKAHHSVLDAYGGPVSFLDNAFARTCLGDAHGHRDGLRAGASVAHLAFYLAEYMGCDPVILIGQDLALTGHVYYAPGTAIHETWQPELNRFCTMEMKEWERIARSRPILRQVPDHDGREVYTEELMYTYLEQFEKDFAGSTVRVIDATEGGARKQGTAVMALRCAVERYCNRPLDPELVAYRRRRPWYDPAPLEAGQRVLTERVSDMHDIRKLCDDTLAVLEELNRLVDRPAEFNSKIRKVERLKTEVRHRHSAFRLITAGAQLAEFKKFSADLRLGVSGAVGRERARRQLARDREFVTTLQGDARRMIAIMEHALSRFDLKRAEYGAASEE